MATMMISSAPRAASAASRQSSDAARRARRRVSRPAEFDDRIERGFGEIVDPVERRRRGEKAELVRATRQQAIDEIGVDAIRREDRFGNALRRILIEIETRRAEAEIEIDEDRLNFEVAGDRPGDVVGDVEAPTAAFCAGDRR